MAGIRGRYIAALLCSTAAFASAQASETITYTYDALGRLTAASSTGTINNGLNSYYSYDPAGNRSQVTVGTGAAPPPPPPPSNSPPTTVADIASTPRCGSIFKNVLANDSDPEGNTPLALVSVSPGTKGSASLDSSTTVYYEAGSVSGTDVLTYTVKDSLNATSTGTLTVTIVSQGFC